MSSRLSLWRLGTFAGAANQKPALTERQCWLYPALEGHGLQCLRANWNCVSAVEQESPKIERRRSEII